METFGETQGLKQRGKINASLQSNIKNRIHRRKKFSSLKKHKTGRNEKFSKVNDRDAFQVSNRKESLKCFICKSEEHLIADCPFNSFKRNKSAKEELVINVAAS